MTKKPMTTFSGFAHFLECVNKGCAKEMAEILQDHQNDAAVRGYIEQAQAQNIGVLGLFLSSVENDHPGEWSSSMSPTMRKDRLYVAKRMIDLGAMPCIGAKDTMGYQTLTALMRVPGEYETSISETESQELLEVTKKIVQLGGSKDIGPVTMVRSDQTSYQHHLLSALFWDNPLHADLYLFNEVGVGDGLIQAMHDKHQEGSFSWDDFIRLDKRNNRFSFSYQGMELQPFTKTLRHQLVRRMIVTDTMPKWSGQQWYTFLSEVTFDDGLMLDMAKRQGFDFNQRENGKTIFHHWLENMQQRMPFTIELIERGIELAGDVFTQQDNPSSFVIFGIDRKTIVSQNLFEHIKLIKERDKTIKATRGSNMVFLCEYHKAQENFQEHVMGGTSEKDQLWDRVLAKIEKHILIRCTQDAGAPDRLPKKM